MSQRDNGCGIGVVRDASVKPTNEGDSERYYE